MPRRAEAMAIADAGAELDTEHGRQPTPLVAHRMIESGFPVLLIARITV